MRVNVLSRTCSLFRSVSLFFLFSFCYSIRSVCRETEKAQSHTERTRDKQFSHAGKIFGDFAFSLSAVKLIHGRQFQFVCAYIIKRIGESRRRYISVNRILKSKNRVSYTERSTRKKIYTLCIHILCIYRCVRTNLYSKYMAN